MFVVSPKKAKRLAHSHSVSGTPSIGFKFWELPSSPPILVFSDTPRIWSKKVNLGHCIALLGDYWQWQNHTTRSMIKTIRTELVEIPGPISNKSWSESGLEIIPSRLWSRGPKANQLSETVRFLSSVIGINEKSTEIRSPLLVEYKIRFHATCLSIIGTIPSIRRDNVGPRKMTKLSVQKRIKFKKIKKLMLHNSSSKL